MKKATKTIKEYSATEKLRAAQLEIQIAQQLESKEVAAQIDAILKNKGYALSAKMMLESGKAPSVEILLVKVQQ